MEDTLIFADISLNLTVYIYNLYMIWHFIHVYFWRENMQREREIEIIL